MDLSKLSNEDLIALHSKQYDKLSDEGLKSLHSQKSDSAQAGNQNGHNNSNQDFAGAPTQKPLGGVHTTGGAFGRSTAPNSPVTPQDTQRLQDAITNNIPAAGGAAGAFVGGYPGAMAGAATGSMLKNLITGDKSQPKQALEQVGMDSVTQGLLPEAGGRAINAVGRIAGKGADRLMQSAAGLKKYIPGVGTELLDRGIWGTKNGMAADVGHAIHDEGAQVDQMIHKLKGSADSEAVANKVANFGDTNVSTNGYSTDEGFSRQNDGYERASNIYNRGEIPYEDANSIAKTAYNTEGYSAANNPKQNYNASLARQEASGYRDQIKDAGDAQGLPIRQKFDSIAALLKANKPLQAPQSLPNGLISGAKDMILSTPVKSGSAQIMSKTGNALSSPTATQMPRTLQMLLNGTQGDGQ